ncbi:FAD-dependent oxidoreductase [Amycolatopsis sp. WQ 127309]|uniref:FAD-dependent oxidoreductase n=1 Tax=Amycolatopsis sp. WQ 127309 TaxID=2932773 RepID=UPI001FF38741|nr:FAD-dependent oxidoreductase [Amycolatopsis sp. WQ 127309]UOZ06994.1 tryptophan 7-halogenase [Amycolatopsis sp. WQ 127309]
MENLSYDVIVVGGGPAGSTAATVVAMRGHRVLLLEKEHFPRYQIGESLLPSTVHGLCRLLGVDDEVSRAGFTLKRGGTFRWGRNAKPWQFSFAMSPRVPEPTSTAFQVERSRFDEILLRNAVDNGVEVREGCAVRAVVSDGDRVRGVEYTDAGGTARTAHARFVVDASGNTSRLHRQLGERIQSDFFRNLAVFGYFAGGARLPEPQRGNIFCAAFDAGWLWYIPLRDDLTSVGAVVAPEHRALIQQDPRTAWTELIAACPEVAEKLDGVPAATEAPYDQVRVRKDYSYWKEKFWAPGISLVGDAACFVDPVLSSGVHLATYGALLAARSVNSCLDGMAEEQSFAEFETRYRREYSLFYRFLISFYDMHRDEKSYFWSAKKLTDVATDETAAFAELVAGLASADADLTDLSAAAADFGHAVDALATAGDEVNPLYTSQVVGATFHEGKRLQDEARFGAGTDPAGGLTTAKDGLGWAAPDVR